MRIQRGTLTLALSLLATLLVTAGAATVYYFQLRLPHPADADRDQLLRWLAIRDLKAEPVDLQRVLALRLEEEFREGVDWDDMAEELDRQRQVLVWENIVVLMKPWFAEKADRYAELTTEPQRTDYLNQFIDTIAVWRGVDLLRPAEDDPSVRQGGLLTELSGQMDDWKAESDPQQAERIDHFLRKVKMRWSRRKLAAIWSALG